MDFCFIADLEQLYKRVEEVIVREMDDPKNRQYPLAFNCNRYSQRVCASLEEFYSRPLLLTSGYLLGKGRKTFYEPLSLLKARLIKGKIKKTINLHVWVTLPDLTIVDATLIYSLRAVNAEGSELAKSIFIRNVREQRAEEKFGYQPVLVGGEYWEKADVTPATLEIQAQ